LFLGFDTADAYGLLFAFLRLRQRKKPKTPRRARPPRIPPTMPPIAPPERPELGLVTGVGEAAATALLDGVAEAEELAGELDAVGDEPAVADVNAWRSDKLMAYVEADGRAASSDIAVSFTAAALSGASGSSRVLQQMLTWSAVSVQVSLSIVSKVPRLLRTFPIRSLVS
jgi:hypothetical protein